MFKTVITLEGTCISLDPRIRIIEYLKPFVERYMKAARFIDNPTFRIESGEFRNIVREMDKASVNISYGVIISALVVFAATLINESVFAN